VRVSSHVSATRSSHIGQLTHRADVEAALKKTISVFMPAASQDLDGVALSLGAKGVVELELVSSGEKWGRGPAKDIHSSLKAMVDSPAWHLITARTATRSRSRTIRRRVRSTRKRKR